MMRLLAALAALSAANAAKPILGAIRWDAWYWRGDSYTPNQDVVGKTVVMDLQPTEFHFRVPFFGKILPNGTALPGLGNSTSVMEQEMAYATAAGVQFWAYCTYPVHCSEDHPTPAQCDPKIQGCCADNNALSYALLNHLELAKAGKSTVNISLVLQAHWFADPQSYGNAETMEQQCARYAEYFNMPEYQRTSDGRPLVFMLGGTADQLQPGLQALLAASKAAGAGTPYLVYMSGSDLAKEWPTARAMGFDAISAYNLVQSRSQNGSSYAANMAFSSLMWEDAKQAGAPVVPTVSAGWDPRPRELYPMPWGNVTCQNGPGNCFMTDPTMDQLTQAVSDGLHFAGSTEPNMALVSAWNENDEGHWIIPSLTQGDAKLQAVKRAVQGYRA